MEHGRCRRCRKRKSSKLPEGVTPDTFGPRVKSIIAALSGFYKNSKREVASIINDIFNLNISVGSISNLTITHKYKCTYKSSIRILEFANIEGIKMANESNEWAKNEFGDAVLGDKRLTDRLVNIADSLISLPESSINEACGSWSEAKAAYRFFQNENVKEVDILASHIDKTVERTKAHKRILVIQDTTYISYSSHKRIGNYCWKRSSNAYSPCC